MTNASSFNPFTNAKERDDAKAVTLMDKNGSWAKGGKTMDEKEEESTQRITMKKIIFGVAMVCMVLVTVGLSGCEDFKSPYINDVYCDTCHNITKQREVSIGMVWAWECEICHELNAPGNYRGPESYGWHNETVEP